MTSSFGRRGRRAATISVLVLAAASACTTNGTATGAPGATSAGDNVPTTVAGTAATGTPIKIGWINMERGYAALPEITDGFEVGVKRVNEFENGVNGHPIELVKCATDATPESSVNCANEMVSAKVVAVVTGGDLGTDAMIPVLREAGIPTMGALTLGTSQTLNNDAFFFTPAATSYPRAEVDLAASLGAKNVTLVLPDVPQVPLVFQFAQQQAALHGITASLVKFDPAAPDFAAALAGVTANGGDAIATIAIDDWCTGLARAALDANFPGKMIMGVCAKFATELDMKKAHGIYRLSGTWGPTAQASAPASALPVIDQFRAAMAAAGRANDVGEVRFGGYATANQVASVLRTIGAELTAANVMTGMHQLTSAPNPLGEPISCSPRPDPGTSACTKGWLQFEVVDANTSKPLSSDFVVVKH